MSKDILNDAPFDSILQEITNYIEEIHNEHEDDTFKVILSEVWSGNPKAIAAAVFMVRGALEEHHDVLELIKTQTTNVGMVTDVMQQALLNANSISYDDLKFAAKQYEFMTNMKDDLLEKIQKGEIGMDQIEDEMKVLSDKAYKMAQIALEGNNADTGEPNA